MKKYFDEMVSRYPALAQIAPDVEKLAAELIELFADGRTLFLAGNGGSAADAEHICGELLKGFKSRRELSVPDRELLAGIGGETGKELGENLQYGLPAISLLSHPALTSAFGNDVDPFLAFAQQLWALGQSG